MNRFGFVRMAVASPRVSVANPRANVEATLSLLDEIGPADVVVFPELGITGYTCGDLFRQRTLHDAAQGALARLCEATADRPTLLFVGMPCAVENEVFNCAVALFQGRVVGVVPKTHIPNYNEFYESRWFRAARGDEPQTIRLLGKDVPFGTDLLFQSGELIVFAEICEDLWMPIPPSSHAAIAGANVLVNLSASNETVAKCEYRTDLVKNQSGRCVAAYAYASSGPSESTTDLVFGGHCLIAENGHLLTESRRVGQPDQPAPKPWPTLPASALQPQTSESPRHVTPPTLAASATAVSAVSTHDAEHRATGQAHWFAVADVDVQRLQTERNLLTSFGDSARPPRPHFRRIPFDVSGNGWTDLKRTVVAAPFVPKNPATLKHRCAEVFGIQCAGLHKRLEGMRFPNVYLGVSGGLDSTLALLVAVKTFRAAGADVTKIHGLTLPGFGTTGRTKRNALELMRCLGISMETIDIQAACVQTFNDLKHRPFGIAPPDASWPTLPASALQPKTSESTRHVTPPTLAASATGSHDAEHRATGWTVASLNERLSRLTAAERARGDLVFENVQARERTKLLMSRGFVIGTGDLSELALGWCTYNGDHMSMYSINCSIPKTLVRWLVRYVAENECRSDAPGSLGEGLAAADRETLVTTLLSIADTTISPELLPPSTRGEIEQSTEANLGPYELHDFFLSNFVRNGFGPEKILWLSDFAEFSVAYPRAVREKTLRTFLTRFFSQQYKRSCVPDGPKVGSVSLSPRGDWRMPSDADVSAWLE